MRKGLGPELSHTDSASQVFGDFPSSLRYRRAVPLQHEFQTEDSRLEPIAKKVLAGERLTGDKLGQRGRTDRTSNRTPSACCRYATISNKLRA
jgi:hypothetical protein